MSADKTGGPAFPIVIDLGQGVEWHKGATLRDYFAVKALGAILNQKDVHVERETDNAAWLAYQVADAMLKERAK